MAVTNIRFKITVKRKTTADGEIWKSSPSREEAVEDSYIDAL